jgi:hypothetical protein
MGGLLFFVFVLAFFIFPNPPVIPSRLDKNYSSSLPMLPLLKIPKFIMTLIMLFVGSLSIGFIEVITSFYLNKEIKITFNILSQAYSLI